MQRKSLEGDTMLSKSHPQSSGQIYGPWLSPPVLSWTCSIQATVKPPPPALCSNHLSLSSYFNLLKLKKHSECPKFKDTPKTQWVGGSKLGRHLKAVFLPVSLPPSTIINWLCKGLKRVLAEPVEDRYATYSGQKSQTNSVKRWQTGELIQKV